MMEMMILKELYFKVSSKLLIDEVLEWAFKWDQFIDKLTCVDVGFFQKNSGFTRSILFEIVERMAYKKDIRKYELRKVAISIVYLSLSNCQII